MGTPFFRAKIIAIAAFSLLLVRAGMGSFFVSASDITVASVLEGVNNERSQRNIGTLRTDPRLTAAAAYKAQDIINRHYFSHTDPEGHYIWDKIIAEGYTPYSILGENLAINFSDTEGLMAAWMNSPTHRANILNTAYKDQGVGVALGNADAGQYSIAIANTFGAQPVTKTNTSASSSKPSAATSTTPSPAAPSAPTVPTINPKVVVQPVITNGQVNLHISGIVSSDAVSVNASVNGQSSNLSINNGVFQGDLLLNKFSNYEQSSLVLGATNKAGQSSNLTVPLNNLPEPMQATSAQTVNDKTTAQSPTDLYGTFKFIVIFFGAIFALALIGDTLFLHKKKIALLGDSGAVLLLIVISALALVSWWH